MATTMDLAANPRSGVFITWFSVDLNKHYSAQVPGSKDFMITQEQAYLQSRGSFSQLEKLYLKMRFNQV